jgi:hypothetical protein
MRIYYDADCGICNTCKNLVLKYLNKETKLKNNTEFLDINNSLFDAEKEKTIVVFKDNLIYKYGAALKVIFRKMAFPFNLLSYLPIFVLTFFYFILRVFRKIFVKKVCKI